MIHKLKYTDKESAISDLLAKGVIVKNDKGFLNNSESTSAVVYIGLIVDSPPVFGVDREAITEATYLEGYHVDVMLKNEVVFENEIFVKNPKHIFSV